MSTEITAAALEAKVAFINGLQLADTRKVEIPAVARAATAGNPSGFIVAGSTVTFVAGVNPQFQSDILNSTLLAQLAANKKYDRESDARNWYDFYVHVMENIGWVVQGFSFTKFNVGGGSLTCEKAVIDILAAIATGGQMAVVNATLAAMKNMSDRDGRLVLFERESHNLHQGNFQISCAKEDNGVVSMSTAGVEFKSSQNITRVLFFSWESASSELYYGSQNMTLNTDVYGRIRQDIINKLGNKASQFVKEIEI